MIRLEPMSDDDFRAFFERAIPRRAERFVARGLWSETDALEASRRFYSRVLPNGIRTPHQHFCHLIDTASGERVGESWYSDEPQGGQASFYISWIWIAPEFRRRGHAKGALKALEEVARRQGASRTILDVWLDNPGAVDLYRKQGYSAIAMMMAKPVEPMPQPPRSSRNARRRRPSLLRGPLPSSPR
jgi:ribosomal protein S18 acetylase RimI-like enzyme